ncbi:MAG: hypothetical protein ACLTZB_04160 [Streptococcus salivarius]
MAVRNAKHAVARLGLTPQVPELEQKVVHADDVENFKGAQPKHPWHKIAADLGIDLLPYLEQALVVKESVLQSVPQPKKEAAAASVVSQKSQKSLARRCGSYSMSAMRKAFLNDAFIFDAPTFTLNYDEND